MDRLRTFTVIAAMVAWALVPAAVESDPGLAAGPAATGKPGDPIRLNDEFADPTAAVVEFQVAPDGRNAVFLQVGDRGGLYSVPTDGGEPIRLDKKVERTPFMGEPVYPPFVISRDSQRVVYRTNAASGEPSRLFSIPINGGSPTRLNAALTAGAEVAELFAVSADSRYVAYLDADDHDRILLVVPIEGGPAVKLVPEDSGRAFIGRFEFTPDSRRVVASYEGQLWSLSIDGNEATLLTSGLSGYFDFVTSPDSSRIAYFEVEDTPTNRLYTLPIEGGPPLLLSGTMHGAVRFSPTGSHLVWLDKGLALMSQAAGNSPMKLGHTFFRSFEVTPDSQAVVFIAKAAPHKIRIAQLDDGARRTAATSEDETRVTSVAVSADSNALVFEAGEALYGADLAGGEVRRLTHPLPAGAWITEFVLTGDSRRLVYEVHHPVDAGLFSSPLQAGTPLRLSSDRQGQDIRGDFVVTPDSRSAVFRSDQELWLVLVSFPCNGHLATIVGTDGDDTIEGTNSDDVIVVFSGNDKVDAKKGDDIICGGRGEDELNGNAGRDLIIGGGGRDIIRGGPDADILDGGLGNDSIFSGRGRDTVRAGPGNDYVEGDQGADVLRGQKDNDVLRGGGNDDACHGGSGEDQAFGCETVTGVP